MARSIHSETSSSEDDDDKYGQQRAYDPDFHGPVKQRSCTDVLCLLLFLVFLVGWAAVAGFAFSRGDPAILLHPTDNQGHRCGADDTPEVSHKPYLFYFDITKCGDPAKSTVAGCDTLEVCVTKCPSETWNFEKYKNLDQQCNAGVRDKMVCKPGVNPTDTGRSCSDLLTKGDCANYVVKSTAVLGRCIPNIGDDDVDDNGMVKDQDGTGFIRADDLKKGSRSAGVLLNLKELGVDAFSDLQNSWWVIIVCCVIAMLLSLLFILLMRCIAPLLVWTVCLGSVALVVAGMVTTYLRYNQLKDTGSSNSINPLSGFTDGFDSYLDAPNLWLGFFIVLCVVLIVLLLVILVLFKRLRVATKMITQASKAVASCLSSLFFPLVPWTLQLGVVALFITLALYIASLADAQYTVYSLPTCSKYKLGDLCEPEKFQRDCPVEGNECRFSEYKKYSSVPYLHVYNVFALLWSMFFCSALGEMILAGTFASWYFTFDKRKNLPLTPLLDSAGRTFRYHLGTLAFGSLIIAIIRMIRVVLEYVSRKCRQYTDNMAIKVILCCCKCCLWCLEKFMRFINRNAYIVCAIYGKNFCASAKDAFKLLMRNILRVLVLDAVVDVLLLLGKLVITALVTVGAYFFMEDRIPIEGLDKYIPTTDHSWVTITVIALASFFIASVFFSVYNMAVDTIFLCFLEDLERNDGSPEKPYYMSKSLMQLLGKKNRRPKKSRQHDD